MMAIDFVSAPAVLTINLTKDADFIRLLETVEGEEFPAGCQIELRFRDSAGGALAVWPATVTTTEAMWNVDKADVNDLIADEPASCRLFYVDGDIDLLWALASSVGVDG
jgi:hypothetical protein